MSSIFQRNHCAHSKTFHSFLGMTNTFYIKRSHLLLHPTCLCLVQIFKVSAVNLAISHFQLRDYNEKEPSPGLNIGSKAIRSSEPFANFLIFYHRFLSQKIFCNIIAKKFQNEIRYTLQLKITDDKHEAFGET